MNWRRGISNLGLK